MLPSRSVEDLVRAFGNSMEYLDEDDEWGGPDLEALWWRTESGPLYWLYRIQERMKTHFGHRYFEARDGSPDGLACAGLLWLRGKVVHRNWDFHVIEIETYETGEDTVGIPQANGPIVWEPRPSRTFEIPYPAWRKLEDLPPHSPDRYAADLAYNKHVAGTYLGKPMRAAAKFLGSFDAR